jgi:hypothetical protein
MLVSCMWPCQCQCFISLIEFVEYWQKQWCSRDVLSDGGSHKENTIWSFRSKWCCNYNVTFFRSCEYIHLSIISFPLNTSHSFILLVLQQLILWFQLWFQFSVNYCYNMIVNFHIQIFDCKFRWSFLLLPILLYIRMPE